MKTAKHFVIDSAAFHSQSAIDSHPTVSLAPAKKTGGEMLIARAFQAILVLGTVGAYAHEALGLSVALVLTLLVLPALAAAATMWWTSKCVLTSHSKSLAMAGRAALVAPGLAIPGALLGWAGVGLLVFAALGCVALSK